MLECSWWAQEKCGYLVIFQDCFIYLQELDIFLFLFCPVVFAPSKGECCVASVF